MNGYVLHGVDGEILLVMRGFDEEEILHIIGRIRASRRKDIKELAEELEKSLYDNGSRRDSSQVGPKNKSKGSNSTRSGRTKTADPKHRSKPRP
jgi:ribosome-binding ATPase YchF (GTP1/OBG family)